MMPFRLRIGTFSWMVILLIAAAGLYRVKYQVLALQSEITQLTQAIEQEREGLHVAAAEWAYLTQPERLQRLNAKYLKLQPMSPAQAGEEKDLAKLQPATIPIVPASAAQPSGELEAE